MISIYDITDHLNKLLQCDAIPDYCPNGLQIAGKEKIQRVVTAVSASQNIIQQAIAEKADCLLVHHGYFWKAESLPITGIKYQRIAQLIKYDINLLAYHLPLDIHPTFGNNVLLGELLELEKIKPHQPNVIDTKLEGIIYSGQLSKSVSPKIFNEYLNQKLQRIPLHINTARKEIKKIAWCTGGGQDYFINAIELGIDAFISGEVSERNYHQAKETDVHYFACGHHATERFGICALGEHLVDQFGIEHKFLDEPNPV